MKNYKRLLRAKEEKMKTTDFIKKHRVGEICPDFDYDCGCHAYDGEECDAAFNHPLWRGLKMADRVSRLCQKRQGSYK